VAGDTASALFGVEGLRVADPEREADGNPPLGIIARGAELRLV